jgi:hypothetical protein
MIAPAFCLAAESHRSGHGGDYNDSSVCKRGQIGWSMNKVTVEIDSKWMRIVRSPLYWIVATLQGVAVSFAPLFLYESGKGWFPRGSEWYVVPLCVATIWIVAFFYIRLGNEVVQELRKAPRT